MLQATSSGFSRPIPSRGAAARVALFQLDVRSAAEEQPVERQTNVVAHGVGRGLRADDTFSSKLTTGFPSS